MTPRVLVACPTFDGKAYALDRYLAAYSALDYTERDLFVVDNTRGSEAYADRLRSRGVDAIHHEPGVALFETLVRSWQHIAVHAHEHGYPLVLSLEQDIVIPPDGLTRLVETFVTRGLKMLRLIYPSRSSVVAVGGSAEYLSDMGCTLMDSRLLCEWAVGDIWGLWTQLGHTAGWLDQTMWLFDIEHLDGGTADYYQWPWEGGDRRAGFIPAEEIALRQSDILPALGRDAR